MIDLILSQFLVGSVITWVLTSLGTWKVFEKCKRPKWHALVPGLREYQLSKCADRENDGRMYLLLSALLLVFQFVLNFLDFSDEVLFDRHLFGMTILMFVLFTVMIAYTVYSFRICAGLCVLFEVRKRWLWLIVFVGTFLLYLIWGFAKKFQPKFIYVDERDNEGAALSGMKAKAMDTGLTVNIEERTATDFFKKRYLLRDIHLNVDPGHMVLLLGGSGAGKTTFVNAVNGYEKAKAEIILNGTSIYDEYGKMKYKIGFVPQMDLMRGNDSVIRTMLDAAKLRLPANMKASERRKRAMEALAFFGLEPVKDRLCDKLSGGQRKRLSIAMEYISNPDLFILDEPDSGLDGVMARELMEGLRKIADQGKIVIVITHSPDRVIDLFDDVIVLAKDSSLTGRLTFFGPIEKAKEFFERDEMEKIVLRINREEEGGEGLADTFIEKYAEVCHG
ncbi:MAG: ABC transporter ATP-binding protein [Lachnospiraceae bacterium]|nr:ABC transporter ATP-binding protein [Lachnospiraceae bacterium]